MKSIMLESINSHDRYYRYNPLSVNLWRLDDIIIDAEGAPHPRRTTQKIGNTQYQVHTTCEGTERLTDKIQRMLWNDQEEAG